MWFVLLRIPGVQRTLQTPILVEYCFIRRLCDFTCVIDIQKEHHRYTMTQREHAE